MEFPRNVRRLFPAILKREMMSYSGFVVGKELNSACEQRKGVKASFLLPTRAIFVVLHARYTRGKGVQLRYDHKTDAIDQ